MTVDFHSFIHMVMAGMGDFFKAGIVAWLLGGGLITAIIIYFLFFR